jgi:hypothetical protein
MPAEKREPRNGAPPETDTDTDTTASVADAPKYSDYEMVPRGLVRTLKRDALNAAEFGLLVFLALSIDHRTGEYANRLSAIQDECAWEYGDEHMKKCLRHLRAELWIEYDMKPGFRGPYVIRLGPRYYAALLHGIALLPELNPDLQLTYHPEPPSELQLTYNSKEIRELSMPDESRDGESPQPTTSRARADTDTDTDTDIETTARQGVSSKRDVPLIGDVGFPEFLTSRVLRHITAREYAERLWLHGKVSK